MLVHSTKLRQFSFYVNCIFNKCAFYSCFFCFFNCGFILLNESCKIHLTNMQNNVCIILFLFLLHFITGFILLNESCKIQLTVMQKNVCILFLFLFFVITIVSSCEMSSKN
jgi:hypothetical protein